MPTVRHRSRHLATAATLAADYKAQGIDRQRAFSQFVIDRSIKPELGARDFYAVYDSVSPQRFVEIEIEGEIEITHVLVETYALDHPKRICLVSEDDHAIGWITEYGMTGATPRQFVESLTPIGD
jgi:hypothetical protein